MRCKSVRTYVRPKIFKIDYLNRKLFTQKSRFLNKIISKNQGNRVNISTEKNALFFKSIDNVLKRDQ